MSWRIQELLNGLLGNAVLKNDCIVIYNGCFDSAQAPLTC